MWREGEEGRGGGKLERGKREGGGRERRGEKGGEGSGGRERREGMEGRGEVGERGEWQGEESDMHGCRLKRGVGKKGERKRKVS